MDLIIEMLCDILFRCRNSSQTDETVKDNLLCAGIACFRRDNCDTDYRYGKMCAGYACCKHTARHS